MDQATWINELGRYQTKGQTMCYDEGCEPTTGLCCDSDYEARTQKCLPEAILLAKRLMKEFGFAPRLCVQTSAQNFRIDFYTLETEFLRLGLL
mgnify:FL=1